MAEEIVGSFAELHPDSPKIKLLPAKVFMLCGLQGTGKSTVAKAIEARIESTLLRTDGIRKQLFPEPKYTSEESNVVYAEMMVRAMASLEKGSSVILDGTHSYAATRAQTKARFMEQGIEVLLVYVNAPEELILQRLDARVGDLSDATSDVYLAAKAKFEIPTDANLVFYNDGESNQDLQAQVVNKLRATFNWES